MMETKRDETSQSAKGALSRALQIMAVRAILKMKFNFIIREYGVRKDSLNAGCHLPL